MVSFVPSSIIRTEWTSGTRCTGQEQYCVCQESNIGRAARRVLTTFMVYSGSCSYVLEDSENKSSNGS